MEYVGKLERIILGWLKPLPRLPVAARKWLGDNVWWIAIVGVVLTGIGILMSIQAVFATLALIGQVAHSFYPLATFSAWSVVTIVVGLVFAVVSGLFLFTAVQPLKEKQKKGWVLLFVSWLVGILGFVVGMILSFNIFNFFLGVIFGALVTALSGYLLFEIHGQFAHTEKSKGVKKAAAKK